MENKKKRVITYGLDDDGWFGVNAMSLVEFPAIEQNFIALSKQTVIKMAMEGERRMLYGPAMIPDLEILRIDDQGEEFYVKFPKEVVMRVAHDFLRKNLHHNATLEHIFAVEGCAVVESWIKEDESDKSVKFGFDLPVGTWFIGMHVAEDSIWNEVKAGTFKGFSIEGLFKDISAKLSAALDEEKLLKEVAEILKGA